jgi:RHS repeat-associated protein
MTGAGYGATAANPTGYLITVTYTWDGGSRITQIVDSQSGTTTHAYDGLDHLMQEQTPQGQVSYTYYPVGLRQSMTVLGQSAVNYTYDNANRLSQVSQSGASAGFGYDSANRRTSLTLPNGIVVNYAYDNASQLTGLSYQNGTTALGNLTYTYDAMGRRIDIGGSLARVSLPSPVSSASYDATNRLTSWNGTPLTYDNSGALLSFGSSTYTWDSRNQLISTSDGGGSFSYDTFGRRISSTVSGSTTSYVYDGSSAVMANSDFLLKGQGPDDLYARVRSTGVTSFLTDSLGSTVALTDGTGATTASYTYEPYGKTSVSGSDDTAFRFTGREDDGATNLYYYRARYYSPQLGRFISQDPTGFPAGANLYAYAGGNPVNSADPSGRCPLCALVGMGIGAVAGGVTAYLEGGDGYAIAYAAGVGGLAGAVAGLTLGAASTMAVGAIAGGVGNAAGQEYSKGSIDPAEVGLSALAGAGGGLWGSALEAAGGSEVANAAFGGYMGAALQGMVDWTTWTNEHYLGPPEPEAPCH